MLRRLLAVLSALAVAAALYWFQPWRLVTDTTVADALTPVTPPSAPASAPVAASAAAPAPAAVVVAEGEFVTHEHDTTGTVRLVRDTDGSHRLELAGLSTSDGPDLRVLLSDQPVRTGREGWHVFDDGRHVLLGKLKGNRGDQVYPIEAGIDPAGYRSVSIWCERFSVSFGAAALSS